MAAAQLEMTRNRTVFYTHKTPTVPFVAIFVSKRAVWDALRPCTFKLIDPI